MFYSVHKKLIHICWRTMEVTIVVVAIGVAVVLVGEVTIVMVVVVVAIVAVARKHSCVRNRSGSHRLAGGGCIKGVALPMHTCPILKLIPLPLLPPPLPLPAHCCTATFGHPLCFFFDDDSHRHNKTRHNYCYYYYYYCYY